MSRGPSPAKSQNSNSAFLKEPSGHEEDCNKNGSEEDFRGEESGSEEALHARRCGRSASVADTFGSVTLDPTYGFYVFSYTPEFAGSESERNFSANKNALQPLTGAHSGAVRPRLATP